MSLTRRASLARPPKGVSLPPVLIANKVNSHDTLYASGTVNRKHGDSIILADMHKYETKQSILAYVGGNSLK